MNGKEFLAMAGAVTVGVIVGTLVANMIDKHLLGGSKSAAPKPAGA